MQTECIAQQMEFSEVERRRVVAQFDGGVVSTGCRALLLKRMDDEAIGLLVDRAERLLRGWPDLELIEFGRELLCGAASDRPSAGLRGREPSCSSRVMTRCWGRR